MKKRSAVISLLSICVLAPTLAFGNDVIEYDSNGQISFQPSTDSTNPLDPLDPNPDKPIKPVDPTVPGGEPNPGTQGPLSIDFASSLDFGTQEITSRTEYYQAASQKYTDFDGEDGEGPNFVQVTDNRGTEAGWSLSVKQNGQFYSSEWEQELDNAEITFNNGGIVTNSDSTKPSESANTIVLNPNGAESHVMTAREGEGAGTYLMTWGETVDEARESIVLEVPGSSTKYATQYTTTFTWTLNDTP